MTSASLSTRRPRALQPLALCVGLALQTMCASAATRPQAPDARRVAQAVDAARERAGVESDQQYLAQLTPFRRGEPCS